MEWSRPFILGITDIPKCFDAVDCKYMLDALLKKGVCQRGSQLRATHAINRIEGAPIVVKTEHLKVLSMGLACVRDPSYMRATFLGPLPDERIEI